MRTKSAPPSPPLPARPHRARVARALAVVVAGGCAVVSACDVFDPPPTARIVGLQEGTLSDSSAPLVVSFSEPVVLESLKLEVVRLATDVEGNLGDEDDDPSTGLDLLYRFTDAGEELGFGAVAPDRKSISITFSETPPIGESLAVLVEPGLRDAEGNETATRERLPFGYSFGCDDAGPTDAFQSGVYFFLVDVEQPVPTQIQLYADIRVDPATGLVRAQFTNADRNPDPSRCSPACDASEACRTLPSKACVIPSTRAGIDDEFPDWVPNAVLPAGFSFYLDGCVLDRGDGTVAFTNKPADVDISSPDVTVVGIQLAAAFAVDGSGVFRGTGSLKSKAVLPLTGAGVGTMTARLVPPELVPPDVPSPP